MTIPNQKRTDLYRSLVLNSGDAMYLSNLTGKIIEVNRQACADLGYSREELLTLSISDIDIDVTQKTKEELDEFFTILEREKYYKLSTHHKRKDGSIYPAEVSVSLLDEKDNKLILGIARDITDHLEATENLISYIDTLEKIHPLIQNANEIEKMILDVLNVVQDVFKTDRAFLFSAPYSNDKFQFSPIEIVKYGFTKISLSENNEPILNYQQDLFKKAKLHNKEILYSNNLEINNKLFKSEMIAVITNKGKTTHLVGIHQCSENRVWTELEEKLFIEISRRLGDAIKRLIYSHNLKQSETKYKALFENAPLSYHSLNKEGEIIDANKTWLNFLGYKLEDVIGKNYGDFLHPDWQETFVKNFPILKERGHVSNVPFKIRHKNGAYKHISLEGCIGSHPDGSFKQTYCVFQDVTAKKETEEKLKESEEKYRLLMEQSPFIVEVYDLDGLQISVNNAYEQLWGFSAKTTLYKFNILKSKEVEDSGLMNYVQKAYAGEAVKVPEYKFDPTGDTEAGGFGRIRWLSTNIYPLKDDCNKVKNIVVTHQDISERKFTEEKLIESEARFKSFVQQAPVPISYVDSTTGSVKYINPRFLDIFGYTYDEVSTMDKWWILAYPDPEHRKIVIKNWENAVELARKTKTDIVPEVYSVCCKDGSLKQILVSGITLGNDFLSILFDVTAQKKFEQKLITAIKKAEENEKLKSAFLANMSHEIRTPMNGIMGFVELLKTPKLSGEKREKYIQIILQSGERMLSTINAIIEISKIETEQIVPEITEINLTKLIQDQCAFFIPEASKKGINLYYAPLTDKKSFLSSDNSMLNSIFTNLINNAIKYTKNGSIEFGYTEKKDFLEFFVKDTGIGIPKDSQKIIFERFTRVDHKNTMAIEGSGLGLSITKAYIELLGGKIWMDSEEGIGSQFFFTLPM